jgi:hypothetical protein
MLAVILGFNSQDSIEVVSKGRGVDKVSEDKVGLREPGWPPGPRVPEMLHLHYSNELL